MPAHRKKYNYVHNHLVAMLESAPDELVQQLSKDSNGLRDKEFSNALVTVFCSSVENGILPGIAIQSHIARLLQSALISEPTGHLFGKSTEVGRRDYWLATAVWKELQRSDRSNSVFKVAMDQWNGLVKNSCLNSVSLKTVHRAVKRYDWLEQYRDQLPDTSILPIVGISQKKSVTIVLVHSGKIMVPVPTACLTEVPGKGEWPLDVEVARRLCRSFIIAVDRYGGVMLPGLLPYFVRAFRDVRPGRSLIQALRLVSDRSGRHVRAGAPEGWMNTSSRDHRDEWLARRVVQLQNELAQSRGLPATNKACIIAAKEWSDKNPGKHVNKDTARTAWNRWGYYVQAVDSVRSGQLRAIQVLEDTNSQVAKLSNLHTILWNRLVQRADSSNVVNNVNLMAINEDMCHITKFNLTKMLDELQQLSLLSVNSDSNELQVTIIAMKPQQQMHDMNHRIFTRSGDYHPVAADAKYPIYQPSPSRKVIPIA